MAFVAVNHAAADLQGPKGVNPLLPRQPFISLPPQPLHPPPPLQLTSSLFSSSSSASRKSKVTGSRKLVVYRKPDRKSGVLVLEGLPTLGAGPPHLAHLGLEVGMQQHVAVQVDGEHIAVGAELWGTGWGLRGLSRDFPPFCSPDCLPLQTGCPSYTSLRQG